MRRRYVAGVAKVRERLLALARVAFDREEWCYSPKCLSGADLADAPLHGCVHRFYSRVAMGEEPEAVADSEDARWREYAEGNNKKVEAAPRVGGSRHPMEGQSVLSHRYTSPDGFRNKRDHLLYMVEKCRREP